MQAFWGEVGNSCARRSWLYRQKTAQINWLRFFQQALPKRKISNSYHDRLISLGWLHKDKDPSFRKLISEPEALDRIREIREDYDINTFIDISVLIPICSTCKHSADQQSGEQTLPEVSFPNWQTHYENIGIDVAIIGIIKDHLPKGLWESLFCFSCQIPIYFPKPFLASKTNNFFVFSAPISQYYGVSSSSGKRPRPWMKDAILEIYGEKCTCCDQTLKKNLLTLDHIIPTSHGGESIFLNLQVLCQKCNAAKADNPPKLIISHITAELLPPDVDCMLGTSQKRIDFSVDDRSHPLAQYFYKIN